MSAWSYITSTGNRNTKKVTPSTKGVSNQFFKLTILKEVEKLGKKIKDGPNLQQKLKVTGGGNRLICQNIYPCS